MARNATRRWTPAPAIAGIALTRTVSPQSMPGLYQPIPPRPAYTRPMPLMLPLASRALSANCSTLPPLHIRPSRPTARPPCILCPIETTSSKHHSGAPAPVPAQADQTAPVHMCRRWLLRTAQMTLHEPPYRLNQRHPSTLQDTATLPQCSPAETAHWPSAPTAP